MNRNRFLLSLVASLPVAALAQSIKRTGEKGFKVNAGAARKHGHITLKGVNRNILDLKVSGSDTGGQLAIFEQTGLSQGRGTPLHVHPNQDEIFYVLEGEYYFRVGDDKYRLKQGDTIFLPKKVPHAWTQVSEHGKMTVILQPAGKLEEFFIAMSSLAKEPTPAEIAQLFSNHEMEVVGPPLPIE